MIIKYLYMYKSEAVIFETIDGFEVVGVRFRPKFTTKYNFSIYKKKKT